MSRSIRSLRSSSGRSAAFSGVGRISTDSARLIRLPLELIDQPRVIELAQADLHLQALRRRVAQVRVIDVRKDLVVRAAGVRSAHVIARVERDPQAADRLAQLDRRVRIFGEMPGLGLDRQANPVRARQTHELAQPIHLRVERRPQGRRGNRDLRHAQHLGRFGDARQRRDGHVVRQAKTDRRQRVVSR